MIVGVLKETKTDEYRVALLPVGAALLVSDGHRVLVEAGAGARSGFPDEAYAEVGAELVEGPDPIFRSAQLIVKVKEPQESEFPLMRQGQKVLTYFHFAADRRLIEAAVCDHCHRDAFDVHRR